MVEDKEKTIVCHEPNAGRLLNLEAMIFLNGGDPFKALAFARRYDQVRVTVSLESIERALMAWWINTGWEDSQIVEALSTEDRKVTLARVERMRRKLNVKEED